MNPADNQASNQRFWKASDSPVWQLISAAGLVVIFFLDFLTPLGFAHGTLYTVVVLAAGVTRNARFVNSVTALAVFFTLVGVLIAPVGESMAVVIANRFFSILTISCVAAVSLFTIQQINTSMQAQNRLNESLRKRMESERLLRIASEAGQLGGWILRLPQPGKLPEPTDSPEVVWSDETCRIHGMPIGYRPNLQAAMTFYAPEFRNQISDAVQKSILNGKDFDFELQIITTRNERIWVRAICRVVKNSDGLVSELHGALQDLTREKLSEETLKESQRRFQQLANAMPLIVWTADAAGTVDYANQALADYTGICNTEFLPMQQWINAVSLEDREYCIRTWTETSQKQTDYEAEFRLRNKKGEYRWHLVQAKPIRDAAGDLVRWYGTAIDIHDRRLLEEKTQNLANRLNNTLESITDGLCVIDKEWRFTYINKQAEKMLRRKRYDLLGRVAWERFADNDYLRSHLEKAISQQGPSDFEFYYAPTKSWFAVHAYPSESGLTVYFYDRTQEVEMREELLRNDERLRLLARATTDTIWDWNPEEKILWWGEGMYKLFGYPPEEVTPDSDFWANCIHPDDRQRVVISIREAMRGTQQEWHEEYRFLRKDGSAALVQDRGYVIRNAAGKAVRMVGGMSDITQRRAIEEQLQQSERLRSVGELTGGVAHDFNNLLTVILGNTEMLGERLSDNPELQALALMTQEAAARGAQLTEHMLAFARRQPLAPRNVKVKKLLDGMESLLRTTLTPKIDIEFVHAGSLWPALVDSARLESTLLNLCLNARDAMPDGGRLTIETANMRLDQSYCELHNEVTPGQYVMVAVTDSGSGISAENLGRVFDPFFTTKEKGKGTGLGLSMVYGFVKQSRGHINIYSEPGQGTTVRMYLPRADTADEPFVAVPQVTTVGGSEKILLVEDDAMVSQFVEAQLTQLGYRIVIAANAKEALQLLPLHEDIDLLFTDVVMPGEMNGRQLADVVMAKRPEVKVLFTSGYTENSIVHHGRLDPGVQLLSKPYRRAELAQRVRQVLDQS